MNLKETAKSLLSLALAFLLTIISGAFIGWVENPELSKATDETIQEIAASGFAGTMDEHSKKFQEVFSQKPGAKAEAPPTLIAILISHQALFGLLCFAAIALFRPSYLAIITVYIPASVLAFISIGSISAGAISSAAIFFIVADFLIRGISAT